MPAIIPNLWFDDNGLEAAEFYVSVFQNSRIVNVFHYPENAPGRAGSVMLVDFELDGRRHSIINGGPQFHVDEAISLLVDCADQDEIDHYWTVLSDGGEEGPCGWLKDRFGLSWQVCPNAVMEQLLSDPDRSRSQRAMQAMFQMRKLDIAALLAAAEGG